MLAADISTAVRPRVIDAYQARDEMLNLVMLLPLVSACTMVEQSYCAAAHAKAVNALVLLAVTQQ